jgi:uncharacterized membrane protein YidH (DUF202 family)
MLPEVALPQLAALLILIGLAFVLCAMAWRWWDTVGTAGQRDVGVASIFRIMVSVAGGIVLAMVLLLLLTAALAR